MGFLIGGKIDCVYKLFPTDDQNIPDANPETIIIGAPLDGTKNPTAATGMVFEDITGVVTYQYVPLVSRPFCFLT